MVKVKWAITPFEDDFELWYRQAGYREGFCQDVPKNIYQYSKDKFDKFLSGYQLLSWRLAKDSSIS